MQWTDVAVCSLMASGSGGYPSIPHLRTPDPAPPFLLRVRCYQTTCCSARGWQTNGDWPMGGLARRDWEARVALPVKAAVRH